MGRYENWHQAWCVMDGPGALDSLEGELGRLGVQRCALVTSQTLGRNGGLTARVSGLLGSRLAGQFTGIVPHVPRQAALRLAAFLREESIDGIVTLGGGSVVDTAKAARLAVGCGLTAVEDFDARVAPPAYDTSSRPLPNVPPVLIALPTTLSGAEFTNTAGVVDERCRRKDLFSYDQLAADVIILDASLAAETPRRLWHCTGMKLMSDAIEQSYGKRRHPVVSALALESVRRLSRHLPGGTDADVIECFRGSWFSMFGVFNAQVFPGIAAGLRHAIGARTGASHGEIAAVLLPHVLRFNLPAASEIAPQLAAALGSNADSAEAVTGAAQELLARLDCPSSLKELGVDSAELEAIAADSVASHSGRNNPRPVSVAEAMELLAAAY